MSRSTGICFDSDNESVAIDYEADSGDELVVFSAIRIPNKGDKHEQILSHQTVSSRVSHPNAPESTLTRDEDQEQSKVTHEVDSQQSIIPTQTSHKP